MSGHTTNSRRDFLRSGSALAASALIDNLERPCRAADSSGERIRFGAIGVGGLPSGKDDEDISKAGLKALDL